MSPRYVSWLAAAAAGFHLWAAGVSPFTALVQRPFHLAFMAALGFLFVKPAGEGWVWLDRLLTGVLLAAAVYLGLEHDALVARSGSPSVLDLALGGLTVVAVLELARRTTGWGLVAIAGLGVAYALLGPWMPGILAHGGYGPVRIVEHLFLSTEGIWGIPLGVSADFVFLFILFGAVLDAAGGGSLLMSLASRVAGRTLGGPAKTAAVASAFMGSLSGSAVANVATTGSFTIPLMRRSGFRPLFAGAVEAAASTGGQLMPPVMGAGAFILATWTSIPYARVAAAAVLPSILFYIALLSAIHFRAGRVGLARGDSDVRDPVLPRIHLLLPLVVLVLLLAGGRSPMRAAFWAVLCAGGVALWRPGTRLGTERVQHLLETTARGAVQVAAACAAAGVVVGMASLTGIGLRLSELIITLSGGSLLPALLLTAVGSLVLGMGLPTTAAYVVLAALGAPALVELGAPVLAAHLFIFYFGCISNVTPPVSLAAYAAAGLSGASPLRTGFLAMALALPGFLIPFVFVLEPALILDGTWGATLITFLTAALGVVSLAAGVTGHLRGGLGKGQRTALIAAAVLLLWPSWWTGLTGGLVVVAVAISPQRVGDGRGDVQGGAGGL